MAKTYAAFKQEFEALKKKITKHQAEINQNAHFAAQVTTIVQQETHAFAVRVQALTMAGHQGKRPDDFRSDGEARRRLEAVEDSLGKLEAELRRMDALNRGDFKQTRDRYQRLDKDLKAEIAARTKASATKPGNKLVANLERLMAAMQAYEDAYVTFAIFKPETIADHRQDLDRHMGEALSKTKGAVMTELQAMFDEQALNTRNLQRHHNRARLMAASVKAEVEKAQAAAAEHRRAELAAAKKAAKQGHKALAEYVSPYERALGDAWIRTRVQESKDKAKIDKAIRDMTSWRDKAGALVASVAKLSA